MTRRGLAGTDSSGGLVLTSYAELPLLGAAPAAPAAGKARAYLDGNGALQLLPSAGILGRRVAVHWGSGTAFPALAAAGDTVLRTDVGTSGSLWQYTGAAGIGAGGWVTESPVICTSTTRPTGAVLYDGLAIFQTDDKATAYWDVANTAWHVWDSIAQTYTPAWAANSGAVVLGTGGTIIGRYRRMGGACWVQVTATVGSSGFNGGTGAMTLTLPIAARAGTAEQVIVSKSNSNAGNFSGFAYITPGTSFANPHFPTSATNGAMNQAQNASAASTAGTGVPLASGAFTWTTVGNLIVEGTYETTG